MILLIITLYSKVFNSISSLSLTEPVYGTYTSDEMHYLKTFYLMKKGLNFYMAHYEGQLGHIPNDPLENNVFLWRFPTIFYFWSLFASSGLQIYLIFWIFAMLYIACVYMIVKKFSNNIIASVTIILLIPYFIGELNYKTSFLFTEWWSLFPFTFGLFFFAYKKYFPAWCFFAFAVLIRELMIIPFIALSLLAVRKKHFRLFFFSLLILYLIFYIYHYWSLNNFFLINNISFESNTKPFNYIHFFNKDNMRSMLSFSMQNYTLVKYYSNFLLVFTSFISFVLFLLSRQKFFVEYLVFFAPWSLLIAFLFIGGKYNDYWGILFMPFLMIDLYFLLKTLGSNIHLVKRILSD